MNIVTLLLFSAAVLVALVVNRPVMRRMLLIGFVWTILCIALGWDWFFVGHGAAIGYGLVKVSK